MPVELEKIEEHMDVMCSKEKKLGTVDHLYQDEIKLTKSGSPDGKHHFIPTSLVTKVDDKVHLSQPGDEIMKTWRTEED